MTKVTQITPATRYQSVPALLAVITVTEFPQIQNWDDRKKFQVGNSLRVDERFWKHQRLFCPRNQASPCLCKLPLKISNLIKCKLVFPFQDETSISEWRWLFVLTAAIYCTFMTIFSVAASGNVQAFNYKAYKGVKTLTLSKLFLISNLSNHILWHGHKCVQCLGEHSDLLHKLPVPSVPSSARFHPHGKHRKSALPGGH